ncbi:MAG: flavodoxin domain-containing protein [Bacteroidales bacterium]|jgi:menaquinone-dependent protoporphyrinogen oxidase|nr:flavodoxin domain-containing protein [Bacteroidales bacterium]
MKRAVIYATTHGTTEKVANYIQTSTGPEKTTLFNLKSNPPSDLSEYSHIIIGGSIHAGSIQTKVKDFCKKNMIDLLEKRVSLFICAMNRPEYESEIKNAFPDLLYNHADSKIVVGGEFLFDKMNFIEKLIVKKVSGINETVSKIDYSAVDDLLK